MKSLLCCFVLLTAIRDASGQALQIWDGMPAVSMATTLHVRGVPLRVREIQTTHHSMGCTHATGVCNTPDMPLFWIQIGTAATNCQHWFSLIQRDEIAHPNASPFPYLELVYQTSIAEVVSDEGHLVYPIGSISCYEALDWVTVIQK
jgi:hypothetical protein